MGLRQLSAAQQGLAGDIGQAGGGQHIETQLHSAGHLIDVLAARARTADEAFLQLAVGNGDAVGDEKTHAPNSRRKALLISLPPSLRGKRSWLIRSFCGTLKAARRAAANSRNSPSLTAAPGRVWTSAAGTSPRMGCGRPISAASATAGCWTRTFSTSMQ